MCWRSAYVNFRLLQLPAPPAAATPAPLLAMPVSRHGLQSSRMNPSRPSNRPAVVTLLHGLSLPQLFAAGRRYGGRAPHPSC